MEFSVNLKKDFAAAYLILGDTLRELNRNQDAIEKYIEWFNNDCDYSKSKYQSNRIKSTGKGKVTSKPSKIHSSIVSNLPESKEKKNETKPIIKSFKTQEEVKEYYNENLKDKLNGRGPNLIKPNDEGYYEATIKGETKVWTCDEIDKGVYIGSANNDYWYYPCYKNKNDKSTLEWRLITKNK